MRKIIGALGMVLALTISASCAQAQARTSVGVGFDRDGLSHFHMAVEETYGMHVGTVPRYIHEDELPVVYLLAREAGVSPSVVMMLREQGWSWIDITYHLGVDPYHYVAHLPRGNAYGYWGYRGRDYRYLTDRHIVDYVNLAFWATYHRRPVTHIIVLRQRVPTWVYYVNYHAPRVVYQTPRRYNPAPVRRDDRAQPTQPRQAQPRQAQPRDATTRGVISPPPRTDARAAPATRPTQPAARPSAPTARPSTPAARPSAPTARPSAPAARPSTPAARPSTPAARPSTPAARPSTPAARPSTPATRPSTPAARPSTPAARPSTPAARPSRPAANTSRPATRRPSGGED